MEVAKNAAERGLCSGAGDTKTSMTLAAVRAARRALWQLGHRGEPSPAPAQGRRRSAYRAAGKRVVVGLVLVKEEQRV
ncbi:hypothetical protein ACWCQP_46760 [Streptomyces chartreusis]